MELGVVMWALAWGAAAFGAEWFVPACPEELPECTVVGDLQAAVDGASPEDTVYITADLYRTTSPRSHRKRPW